MKYGGKISFFQQRNEADVDDLLSYQQKEMKLKWRLLYLQIECVDELLLSYRFEYLRKKLKHSY